MAVVEVGYVTLLIYDIPCKYTSPNGYGVQPSRPRHIIYKYVKMGWVARLQNSVLQILDSRAIEPIVEAITAAGGHVLLIRGDLIEYIAA